MRGIPTVRMPVLTLFTNSTRDNTVMTRNDRPLLSAKVLDSITCLFISELVRLRSALHMVRIRVSLLWYRNHHKEGESCRRRWTPSLETTGLGNDQSRARDGISKNLSMARNQGVRPIKTDQKHILRSQAKLDGANNSSETF
jgi:hypothetical protein